LNPDLHMLPQFSDDLKLQVIEALGTGRRSFLLWGLNETCVELVASLRQSGIGSGYLAGIVDPDTAKQGGRIFDIEVIAPDGISALEFDALVITSDSQKEEALRGFARHDSRIPEVIISGMKHEDFSDPDFERIASSCLVKSYANGYPNSLIHIYQSIKYLADSGISGDVAEFGIFKGGTVVFIAKTLRHFGFASKIYGFDIFDGFPSRKSLFDMYSNPKCEFKDFAAVEQYCATNGVDVVKGDICETYQALADVDLMLTFFDTDNYSPTRAALDMCFERTLKGGVIAFDHFVSDPRFIYTIGERMAASEALSARKVLNLHGTGVFIKL